MSYAVSTLRNVPSPKGLKYFIYIVEEYKSTEFNAWCDKNFENIGRDLGGRGAIVKGYHEQFGYDIHNFLDNNIKEEDKNILRKIIFENICLIISKGNILLTDHPVLIIPIVTPHGERVVPSEFNEFITELMKGILKAMKNDEIIELGKNLGFTGFDLKKRGGIILSTLKKVNEYLELKPNIVGIGLNINSIIENILAKKERKIL